MGYGAAHAELYDPVFLSRGKDFEAEAEGLNRLVRSRLPGARSLLDVACGTGAHLENLAKHFDHVEGLDHSPAMREVARGRLPGVAVHPGDMRDFELHRTFDVVTCMGSGLAEADSPEQMADSVARMSAHLAPGGVLIVEPWYFPDNFLDGHAAGHLFREGGRVVSRLTHSARRGDKSRVEIRFMIVDSSGFREFTEVVVKYLLPQERYEAAFERAGCSVEFVPGFSLADGRPNSPGLFVGVRAGEPAEPARHA